MNIREYLFRNDMKVCQLAKKLDCHPNHLAAICRGDTNCGKFLKKQIEIVTSGEVKADEWPTLVKKLKNPKPTHDKQSNDRENE